MMQEIVNELESFKSGDENASGDLMEDTEELLKFARKASLLAEEQVSVSVQPERPTNIFKRIKQRVGQRAEPTQRSEVDLPQDVQSFIVVEVEPKLDILILKVEMIGFRDQQRDSSVGVQDGYEKGS
jgi:hypothetical protein